MKKTEIDHFHTYGAILLQGVLAGEEVDRLRQAAGDILARAPPGPGDDPAVRKNALSRFPEVATLLGHATLTGALAALLGDDFVYLPDSSVEGDKRDAWRKGTTVLEASAERFHEGESFRMIEAVFLLEANGDGASGGFDIVPGSHRHPDLALLPPSFFAAIQADPTTVPEWLRDRYKPLTIHNQPGDLLLLDLRTDRRETPAEPGAAGATSRRTLTLRAASAASAPAYLEYLHRQPDSPITAAHRYPDWLLATARQVGARLAGV